MLRRSLLSFVMLCFAIAASAQVAKWGLKPEYDKITINNIGMYVVEKDGKLGLYNEDWKEILPVKYDVIRPFSEGYATLFSDGYFVGFVSDKGKFVDLFNSGFSLREGAEDFHSGRLMVNYNMNGITYYRYVDCEGRVIGTAYAMAHPYSEGYAVVKQFTNPERDRTLSAYDIIDVDGNSVKLGEERNPNLTFVSSFTNGRAILIMKNNKFYTISPDDTTPHLMYIDNVASRKNQITFYDNWFDGEYQPDGTFRITARNAWFRFDSNMSLIEYKLGDYEVQSLVKEEAPLENHPDPILKPYKEGRLYGFGFNDRSLLPPQFEEVVYIGEDFSIVKLHGKYGVITVDETATFRFMLNSQDDVGFMHKTCDVKLAVSMPTFVDEKTARIESHSESCELFHESREGTRNVEGNFITYNKCRLNIPSDLSETAKEYHYKFSVRYDGLMSEIYDVGINEWYVMYYNVRLGNTEFKLSSPDEAITIDFHISKTEEERFNTQPYPKDVRVYQIMSDGTEKLIDATPISETHYSFLISKVESNRVSFLIHVQERGCPTIEYPFVINFDIPEPVVDSEGVVEPQVTTATVEVVRQRVRPAPTLDMNIGGDTPKVSIKQEQTTVSGKK